MYPLSLGGVSRPAGHASHNLDDQPYVHTEALLQMQTMLEQRLIDVDNKYPLPSSALLRFAGHLSHVTDRVPAQKYVNAVSIFFS